MKPARGAMVLLLEVALAIGAAACVGGATPTPSFCDGIDAAVGGCAPDRPTFTGRTCAAVGQEFGRQLNERLLAVYDGPSSLGGESRAVRAGKVTSVTISLANLHLRQVGIVAACGADEFIAAAETAFSDALKAQAGKYLSDGVEVPYADWLADLRHFAGIIDAAESAPVPSF